MEHRQKGKTMRATGVLNDNMLVGFAEKRKFRYSVAETPGLESNRYPGAIPAADIVRRLFGFTAVSSPVSAYLPADMDDMTTIDSDGNPVRMVTSKDFQAVINDKTGKILGIHSSRYTVHQYPEWLMGTLSNIVGQGLAYSSCGIVGGGAKAWVQIERPDNVLTPEGVEFRAFLLATSSHDGSTPSRYSAAINLIICDNMRRSVMEKAEHGGAIYRVKHTRNSVARIADARQALNIVHDMEDSYSAEVAELCSTTVTDRQLIAFLDEIAPMPDEDASPRSKTLASDKRDEIIALYRHDPRCEPWKGTAFGVLQSVSTWETHIQSIRNATRADRNASNLVSGQFIKSDTANAEALALVLAR